MNKVQTNNGRLVLYDPQWYESGANLPAIRQQPHIDRVINRVIQKGDVTILEREVVYAPAPRIAAVRERSNGGPRFVDADGNPARPELVAKYYAGAYGVIDLAPEVPRQVWER